MARARHIRAQQFQRLLPGTLQAHAERLQDLRSDSFLLPQQTEQQMLRADVAVVQFAGLGHGELQHLLGSRRVGQLTHRRPGLTLAHLLFGALLNLVQIDVQVQQHGRRDAFSLTDQPQQDVLGPDIVVLQANGLLSGHRQNLTDTICEIVIHRTPSRPEDRSTILWTLSATRHLRILAPQELHARSARAERQGRWVKGFARSLPPGGHSERRS